MNINVRNANINDLDKGLLDSYIQGYRYHQNGRPDIFDNLPDETLKENLLNDFENFSFIVVCDNDTVIGYLAYLIKNNKVKKLKLEQLIISEKYRGHGLGKMLIEKAKAIAIENHCKRIELDCWTFNKNALDMYEHVGFNKQRILFEMPLNTD